MIYQEMTVRSWDFPPLRDRCGFLRIVWFRGAPWRGWSAGECRYYGWHYSISFGPVIVFVWPMNERALERDAQRMGR